MWLLTCSGDLFRGKKIWLRPGTTHLLGRTSGRSEAGPRIQYIEHKSVSRKHLLISVEPVAPGDGARIHVRSSLIVTDGSKVGTTINGDKFSKEVRTLNAKDGEVYTITLGSYEHTFRLWWEPVTISLTSSSAAKKTGGTDTQLAAVRASLEQADVKMVMEYVSGETTHAVGKKRNTPPGLQALVQGRWLVTQGWVDALAAVVKREGGGTNANGAGDENGCLLEEDFDANWPKEEDYIIPSGAELHARPNEYCKPNPERAEVFKDFDFIFLSRAHCDTLLPVITNGGGKALCWEVRLGESKYEDVVNFVKEIAGQKRSGAFKLSQLTEGTGGVVVVRLNERNEECRNFLRNIDRALGQRSVEQNEFLDAILTIDATGLRRQLEFEPDNEPPEGSDAPATPISGERRQQDAHATVPDASLQLKGPPSPPAGEQRSISPSGVAKSRNRRIVTRSRFQGFDDFDPSQIAPRASESPEQSESHRTPSEARIVQTMDVDEPFQPQSTQQRTGNKRPPPLTEQSEDALYDEILPGAAAFKRKRIEAASNGNDAPFGRSVSIPSSNDSFAKRERKEAIQLDVLAEVQKRRAHEDEQRRLDEESLRQALDGVDINELKNLARVEEMDVPVREKRPMNTNGNVPSERWNPSWNGRKNFKKFRPKGQRREDIPRLQRVIVTLEEVSKNGRGVGDEYWLHPTSTAASGSTNTGSGNSKSQSQLQAHTLHSRRSSVAPEEEDGRNGEGQDAVRFRRRLQSSRDEDAERQTTDAVLPEEIAGRARDPALQAVASATTRSKHAPQTWSKRPLSPAEPGQEVEGPAKRAKQSHTTAVASTSMSVAMARERMNPDDDDDDDELKFRRRRR